MASPASAPGRSGSRTGAPFAPRRPPPRAGGGLGEAEHPRPDPGRGGPRDPVDESGGPVPAARGRRRARARWVGAGFPDYPWMFATDGEYTAFASVAVGQFAPIKDHLRALRDISNLLNDRSGVVTHEVVSDGSIWFGHDSRTTDPETGEAVTTSTPTRRSSSRAPSRSSGAGPATTPSATTCTTSRGETCATSSSGSTRTATAGRRDPGTSSAAGWASRSSTTRST
jgi:hypothetical protein